MGLEHNRENIECAILATFLYANEMSENISWTYPLDLSVFTSPLRVRVAERVNNVSDGCYGFLSYELEDKIAGTIHESDWLDILAQTPLSNSRVYHDSLVKQEKMRNLI